MKTWIVYSLDVWGNEEDGFEVNDRCRVGTIETSDEQVDAEVWAALIKAGIARGSISHASFDGDDTLIMINTQDDGRPVFQLELE